MSVNIVSEEVKKEIIEATLNGDLNLLDVLIEELPKTVNIKKITDSDGNNLLHLAVKSKSLFCVEAVSKLTKFHEFDVNNEQDNPLHFAVKLNSAPDIIEYLCDYRPLYLAMDGKEMGTYPQYFAYKSNNVRLSWLLICNEARLGIDKFWQSFFTYDIFKPTSRLPSDHRILYNLINVHVSLSNAVINPLFSNYIEELNDNLSFKQIEFVYRMLIMSITFHYKTWIIRNIYSHKTNKLKSLVDEVLNVKFVDIMNVINFEEVHGPIKKWLLTCNNLKIVFFLHSGLIKNWPEMLNHYDYYDLYLEEFFECTNICLFWLFLSNRNVFEKVLPQIKVFFSSINDGIFCTFPVYIVELIKGWYIFYEHSVEYLDYFEARNINYRSKFRKFYPFLNTIKAICCLMPFIAIPCADELISLDDVYRKVHAFPITKYCSQYYSRNILKLTMLCRIVVRKAVFKANEKSKNSVKLEKLSSLNMSNKLKNFLFFNYTNYDMFKKENSEDICEDFCVVEEEIALEFSEGELAVESSESKSALDFSGKVIALESRETPNQNDNGEADEPGLCRPS